MWPGCSDVGRTPVLQRSMVLSWLVKPEEDSPLEVMSTPRWGSYGSRGRWPVPHLHTTEEYIPFIHIIMEMSILYTTISVTKVGNKPTNLFSFFYLTKGNIVEKFGLFVWRSVGDLKKKKKKVWQGEMWSSTMLWGRATHTTDLPSGRQCVPPGSAADPNTPRLSSLIKEIHPDTTMEII